MAFFSYIMEILQQWRSYSQFSELLQRKVIFHVRLLKNNLIYEKNDNILLYIMYKIFEIWIRKTTEIFHCR